MITCILVDDEISCLDRLEQLLSGFEEIRILSKQHIPEVALTEIIRLKPDIVFLDVEMPRMSGFQFVNEIRKENYIPIFIFITAYEHYALKALKNDVFDYVLKPVDIDELKNAIDRYILKSNQKINSSLPTQKNLLSEREKQVLRLLIQGKTSKEISEILFLSKATVDTHRRNLLEKTNSKNIASLISLALKNGWV